jgi:5-(carboxyamino)imidazole ribonucleotide synthase
MNGPLLPPATIGIIGGGQLGMMLIREAQRMGYRSAVWDPDPACPAARLADRHIVAPYADAAREEEFLQVADVITYEFEHIDLGVVTDLERRSMVRPGSRLLAVSCHRREEKAELERLGFPVARHAPASDRASLQRAFAGVGFPAVVKTATAGYDGKGQTVLRTHAEADAWLAALPPAAGEYIVEQWLDLECELSVIVARTASGSAITFPVGRNVHRDNILHTTTVPAGVSDELLRSAEELALAVSSSFNLAGVLCVEMFVTSDGALLVNELAPRPHNSGHYSLDACSMSQFEAAVRAVCGLPLPAPRLLAPCVMVNLLGKHLLHADLRALLAIDGAKLHLYGKVRVEPRRKMGHVTVLGSTPDDAAARALRVASLIEPQPG